MEYKLIIPGVLPGLNEYINAERRNKYQAAQMKKQAEHLVITLCRSQLKGVHIEKPVFISYRWIEKNRRRDKSNVAFAKKFLEDGLVKAGVLKNDGWNEIAGFADEFDVDPKRPRIIITIKEVE
ncbi:hypothetical protein [Mahella australiensis]|uniref:Endodeoxyribonuclease RusA n=1 Tax=Mahella australiensis (strain DSM 15567 / CIP 107919 / 50-1 BON) TaxID=697281 RepID=F3ZZF2_MAHA5|nr:hypothetical protein [Mahella australiensis]AEE95762.1 endodeoxyribonuclease RusA [Mahella australiensis 50-1 BON]